MGRIVYWMNVSLDLFIEAEAGENGGGSWMRITDELHRDFNRRTEELALLLHGRVVYEIMEDFWPAAAEDDSANETLREYGRIWTDKPKVLVSRTRTEAPHNTRVVSSIDEVAKLRQEVDGDIGVGGAMLPGSLLEAGLVDELVLYYHPTILGKGRPLFDGVPAPVMGELLESASFDGGAVMHRYALQD